MTDTDPLVADSDAARDATVAYDVPPDDSLSEGVVTAVAAAADADPIATGGDRHVLDPLYDAIDPDALDEVFRRGEGSDTAGRVTFTYEGFDVTVRSDGTVLVG